MDTKHIRIQDYNYDLPDERIAKFHRLLCWHIIGAAALHQIAFIP